MGLGPTKAELDAIWVRAHSRSPGDEHQVPQFPHCLIEFVDGAAHQRPSRGVSGQGVVGRGENDIQVQSGG